MSRSMWILAAIFAVMAVAMIYQSEVGGGIDRPWADCRESLVQQLFSGACTPRAGRFTVPAEGAAGGSDLR